MAEFGEQLRKAREGKGMTQQSLAEKLYVTRQTVSRWESGERYPDLLTVKKISQVLEAEVGFLLSDDDTQHIVERNPVIEKAAVSNVTLILFAGIAVSYLISLLGIILRIPAVMRSITAADFWVMGCNITSELSGAAAFIAGFIWSIKESFSPKKAGAVMMAFFASTCAKALASASVGASAANRITAFIPAAVSVIGIAASCFCFRKKTPANIWYRLVIIVSVLGMLKAIYTVAATVIFAGRYVSAETALHAVLTICIYALFCIQTSVLCMKRKRAKTD